MFDSFISWLMNVTTSACTGIMSMMLECLNVDLASFIRFFPVAATLYVVLQSVAIGVVFAFAVWNLGKFLTGHMANLTESPIQILVMSGISVFLIFFGNYLLQTIVNIFSYPYADMLSIHLTKNSMGFGAIAVIVGEAGAAAGWAATGVGGAVVAAIALISIIIVIMLAYQIIALLFEMIERWIMLGVLIYTSPLAWATIVSVNSRVIFSKWLNMFLSQCLMLLINAWSVKMVFSVMTSSSGNSMGLMSIVVALCFCKVARQLDTYMKQIGLNPAGTGRSLLDDIRSTATMAYRS